MRHFCSLIAATAAAAALAADEPGPRANEQGIEAARREYDAIKAAASPQAQQQLSVPVAPTIELKTDDLRLVAPPGAGDWWQQQKLKEKEREKQRGTASRSANWLVDAMAQTKSPQPEIAQSAETPAPGELQVDPRTDFVSQAESLKREAIAGRNQDDRKRDLQRVREEAGNPLERFMAGWMTPGDFALLLPRGGDGDGRPPAGPAPTDAGTNLPAAPLLPSGDQTLGPQRSRPPDGRPPNPYLADLPDLNVAATGPVAGAANLPPAPIPPPTTLLPPPEPTPEPPPRSTPADEFRKAQNEQKYFKQLKRF